MSDSPNIIISEITAEKLRKELIDIRKWYGDYEGEKEIKLIKAKSGSEDKFNYSDILKWTTIEELEGVLDGGTFEEWQKQFTGTIICKPEGVENEWAEEKKEYQKKIADDSDYLREDYRRLKFTKLNRKESGVRFGAYRVDEANPETQKAYLSANKKAKNRKKNKASRANRRKSR